MRPANPGLCGLVNFSRKHGSKSAVLNLKKFGPGDIRRCLVMFLVVTTGGGEQYLHLGGGIQECCCRPYNAQASPPTLPPSARKNYLAPSGSGAKAEELV